MTNTLEHTLPDRVVKWMVDSVNSSDGQIDPRAFGCLYDPFVGTSGTTITTSNKKINRNEVNCRFRLTWANV
ncbi:hypothetical protein C8J48_0594 [Desmospora activa DSM 45169]|uniref:Uncharacterized protein n=1 Tax=Desmospora activa DSM 45169 TaxID=1121389 RepID=A0A2T4Z7Z7_9BACL|nr:hypothetical protein C8J48_0594 [Desmospora activa DSM 45169]